MLIKYFIFFMTFSIIPVLSGQTVIENERKIPVAYAVDVAVVGGNTRAVAAALAAKKNGASVFLMARKTYLGSDMCSTYRLWLEKGEKPTTPLAKAIFEKGTPTPLYVKTVLDNALINAGVDFLYGCYPSDVLRDKKGRLAGLVMANRSGRQAVLAKVIIDATDRGVFTRIAGAEFSKYPAGTHTFQRIVLGGNPGKEAKELPITFTVNSDSRRKHETKTYKTYEYTLNIVMADASWKSFANADSIARNRTWQDGQADASESLFQIPPDNLHSKKSQVGEWTGTDKFELDSLRPKDVENIYVLGGCADVSREAAAKLLRPVHGMELGKIVGTVAAKYSKALTKLPITEITVSGKPTEKGTFKVGEMLKGLRSTKPENKMDYINSPSRCIPVLGEYDVVIVGGGTSGAPACISAARLGAKTLVVEYLDGLGGVGTLGRISKYYHGNKVGFTEEIDKAVGGGSWNIEKKMEWFRKEIVKAGGNIWFNSLACGSVVKGKCFKGVVVATPQGRGIVLANTVIDSTGNSVIPACAGLPCQGIDSENISIQGSGLPTFSPGVGYLNGDWTFNDDSDVLDMWRTFVLAKYKINKVKRKFQNPFDLGQLITTRARRRIIGDIVITPMDIINRRTFPDTITIAKSNFDNHGFSSHTIFMVDPPHGKGLVGNIPYRALMPKDYDGILVTGLGISAHGDAMPVLRMQADVQNQGFAAGYAAAMAAKANTTVRKIDIKKLQHHLVDKGIISEKELAAKDSYPISDKKMQNAVDDLPNNTHAISLILTDVPRAMPMLIKAWHNASSEKKLPYAHVLGILGNGTGVETLIDALKDAEWDKGWNFRGMGQYGRTTSPVDNLVIALGRTGDNKSIKVLLRMLKKLTNKSEFSHCRAVAMALESIRDPRAAKPLADLLRQEGIMGHAFVNIDDAIKETRPSFSDTKTRNNSLKELILARALYRCGDYDGLGEKILKSYAQDLRGHYATHAKAILEEKAKNFLNTQKQCGEE